jgi:hypothetical protein
MNLLHARDGIWTQQYETLCVFNVELYPAKSGITFCAMRVCVIPRCHLATMTTPFMGLFIAASCNSRSSHGQYTRNSTKQSHSRLLGPLITSFFQLKPWRPRSFAAARHQPRPSTHACASGPRVRQSRGCHYNWYDPSVLALDRSPRYFAAPRLRASDLAA